MKPYQSVRWSKREGSLLYRYEGDKPTSGMIAHYFEGVKQLDAYGMRHGLAARIHTPHPSDELTLAQDLDARGYDLTTLKFSICKKPQA